MNRKTLKAQNMLEYSLLICVVIAVLIVMKTYMARGIQERYRQSADVFGEGQQFAPGLTRETGTIVIHEDSGNYDWRFRNDAGQNE